MAKRKGLRVVVLSVVGAATLVCLVFAGLLIHLVVKIINTSPEQAAAREENQQQIHQQFEETFGPADGQEGGVGEIDIDFGDKSVPGVGAELSDTAPAGDSPESDPTTQVGSGNAAPQIISSGSHTITIDIDAAGNASFEGQPLTEDSLRQFLTSLEGEENIVLDVHPACDSELSGLWWLVCSEAGYTAETQRVADLPR